MSPILYPSTLQCAVVNYGEFRSILLSRIIKGFNFLVRAKCLRIVNNCPMIYFYWLNIYLNIVFSSNGIESIDQAYCAIFLYCINYIQCTLDISEDEERRIIKIAYFIFIFTIV